ncbi:MAG TPA: ATP-binding cassette domain-containing protein, partial [Pirellulaceae bacterium]
MIVLKAEELRKYFGPEPVLDGTTIEVRKGRKIGLVGPNGTGKTTLLKILAGDLETDGGSLYRADSIRIGYLKQQPDFDPQLTVTEVARQALRPLLHMLARLESLSTDIAQA